MGQLPVDLNSMSESMPEVEYLSNSKVIRIRFGDAVLDARHLLDKVMRDLRRRQKTRKHHGISNRSRLHHLHLPVHELLLRERLQEIGFYADQTRRIEVAYAVFHPPEVNGRLAPDGGIYHRQQRGGHMDVADAPFVPRSHISA